jgi:GGDEF domain-containing protein
MKPTAGTVRCHEPDLKQCTCRDVWAVGRKGSRESGALKVCDMARARRTRAIAVREAWGESDRGASIGVACNADAEGGWKALLARADEMVYRAKDQGRGRYVLAAQEGPQLPERQLRAS